MLHRKRGRLENVGPWDAIVQAEAKTLPAPSRLVVGQIRVIQGVQARETLVTAEL